MEQAEALVAEYVEGLGLDLGFQDIEAELREFPGEYAPPEGRLLAMSGEEAAVCRPAPAGAGRL